MKKITGFPLLMAAGLLALSLAGCSKASFYSPDYDGKYEASADAARVPGSSSSDIIDGGGEGEGGAPQYESGVVTAGEWNDIAHWDFWSKLLNNQDWDGYASNWLFYPRNFVCVELKDDLDLPVCGAKVVLLLNGQNVWEAVSDNTGRAVLWATMWDNSFKLDPSGYSLKIGEKKYEDFEFTTPNKSEVVVNHYQYTTVKTLNAIDVAFIVDATGSMGDEIGFLKKDLQDILKLVGQQCTAKVRTGTVFYRDEGDEYVVKHSQFTDDLKSTIKFIGNQEAGGGGDWPEAVHTALESGLQDLQWDLHARSRVAFMVLDAPPHKEDNIIASCQKSIAKYAQMGIKIVPVSASGIDKATEYLLRSFAMATNGTYVFITNDSGVGNEHIEATVGEYQVEKLRDLIARLIVA